MSDGPGTRRPTSRRKSARIFKAHLPVGGYDPRDPLLDPLLDPVWGMLCDAAVPPGCPASDRAEIQRRSGRRSRTVEILC